MISDKPAKHFFELFHGLIFLNATQKKYHGILYDPESLISQIIDKIREIQEIKRGGKTQVSEEKSKSVSQSPPQAIAPKIDPLKLLEIAAENEKLLIGLLNLTGVIINSIDKEARAKIIEDKDLLKEIFEELIFGSVYRA